MTGWDLLPAPRLPVYTNGLAYQLPVGAAAELEEANTTLRCPLKLGKVVGVHDSASMLEEPCNEQTEEKNDVSSVDKEDINLGRNNSTSFPKSRTFLHDRWKEGIQIQLPEGNIFIPESL